MKDLLSRIKRLFISEFFRGHLRSNQNRRYFNER
jgi:hypothetical protein